MGVTAVSAHLVEDDALYFDVHWDNGTTSEEPLEALVDADGTTPSWWSMPMHKSWI